MFGMGWSEMVLIGVVALIVVGPKDLPNMFRSMGQFTGKARGMAREFSRAMEAAADDAGVSEISKTIKAAANPKSFGTDKLREAAGLKTPAFGSGTKSDTTKGPATAALSAEREANRAKIADATAKAATERKAREAEAAKADAKPVAQAPIKGGDSATQGDAVAQAPIKGGASAMPGDAPKAAPKPKAPAKPKAAAKPKATAKPKAADAADPAKTPAKPRAPRKSRAAKPDSTE